MADKNIKLKQNVPGKFYVDESCIGCSACLAESPENFSMDSGSAKAYVSKQPESSNEEESCKSALAACPVNAIGDDGE